MGPMTRSEVGKRRYRVGDHRQIEAKSARLLPKSTPNPPVWVPSYANIGLATHCFYVDSSLFTTLFKMTGPFQTLAREVKSADRITHRTTDGDYLSLVPPAHPRARMTLVSFHRLGGIQETRGVRRHSISRPAL